MSVRTEVIDVPVRAGRAAVCEIVLDRAAKRNALTPAMLEAIAEAASRAHERAGSILLRGEGASLCAGFDLELARDDAGALAALLRGLALALRSLRGQRLPVVAGAQGHAIAGGCALLGGCDAVIGHPSLRLGYPVVGLGVSPAISAPTLGLMVSGGAMRRLLFAGEVIDGERAHALGLVSRLVEMPEDVIARGQLEAGRLAMLPGGAVRATRACLDELDGVLGVGDAGGVGIDAALEASLSVVGNEHERRAIARLLERRRDS